MPPPPLIVLPPPPAAPPPGREYPKIALKTKSCELVQSLMVTSKEKKPGEGKWSDVFTLMEEIGFTCKLRKSRGGLDVFYPTPKLKHEQVSHVPRF